MTDLLDDEKQQESNVDSPESSHEARRGSSSSDVTLSNAVTEADPKTLEMKPNPSSPSPALAPAHDYTIPGQGTQPIKIPLTVTDAPEVLGYAFPQWKKWLILSVVFIVQCSMNFNASVYANGVPFLTEKFGITAQKARVGQMVFLISYAFGCELWAPWSEELGRWGVLQASLALVNCESQC